MFTAKLLIFLAENKVICFRLICMPKSCMICIDVCALHGNFCMKLKIPQIFPELGEKKKTNNKNQS